MAGPTRGLAEGLSRGFEALDTPARQDDELAMLSDPTVLILMYFVLPIWLLAGFADWLCHRASHIESTTGARNHSFTS